MQWTTISNRTTQRPTPTSDLTLRLQLISDADHLTVGT